MSASGKWEGEIHLINNKSCLTDMTTKVPLSGIDFEGEDGECLVYLMSSCPGIFNGDEQKISCRIHEGAHFFLTDASATELHPNLTDEPMLQSMEIQLGRKSVFEYMPEPVIPFKGSNFQGKTRLLMEKDSQAAVSQIVTAGRVGRGEIFQYDRFKSEFEVFRDGRLEVWDSFDINPKMKPKSAGIMGKFTHYGTLWLLSEKMHSPYLEKVRDLLAADNDSNGCYGGASLLHRNGLVVRMLGYNSESIKSIFDDVWGDFRAEFLSLQPLEVLK